MKKKKYVSNKIPLWVQSKMRNLKAIKGEGKGSVFFFPFGAQNSRETQFGDLGKCCGSIGYPVEPALPEPI